MSLDTKVGHAVTIQGVARNAAGGAVVMTDDREPIYLSGVERWDSAANGKHVSVKGTLRKQGGQAATNDQGEAVHGIPDAHFVIDQPSWTVH